MIRFSIAIGAKLFFASVQFLVLTDFSKIGYVSLVCYVTVDTFCGGQRRHLSGKSNAVTIKVVDRNQNQPIDQVCNCR